MWCPLWCRYITLYHLLDGSLFILFPRCLPRSIIRPSVMWYTARYLVTALGSTWHLFGSYRTYEVLGSMASISAIVTACFTPLVATTDACMAFHPWGLKDSYATRSITPRLATCMRIKRCFESLLLRFLSTLQPVWRYPLISQTDPIGWEELSVTT